MSETQPTPIPTFTQEQQQFALQVWRSIVPSGKNREQVKANLQLIEEIEAILHLIPVSDSPAANGQKPNRKRK